MKSQESRVCTLASVKTTSVPDQDMGVATSEFTGSSIASSLTPETLAKLKTLENAGDDELELENDEH